MKNNAKILILDIETAPNIAAVWGFRKQFVSFDMIGTDWYILAFAAKWLGSDKVIYKDKRDSWNNQDDRQLLRQLHSLLHQADIVVAHNGDNFDLRAIDARLIIENFPPRPPIHSVDTFKESRKRFRFPSHSLEYVTSRLLPDRPDLQKIKSAKFPGYKLWKGCLEGNQEAWAEMEAYNRQDVVSLEALYLKLRGWMTGHPNVALYDEPVAPTEDPAPKCSHCGSTNLRRNGTRKTKVSGVYQRYKCMDCGAWPRARTQVKGYATSKKGYTVS